MKSTRIRAQRSDSIRGEAAWIPQSLAEVEQVRRALTDAGNGAVVVNGVTGWLIAKALGEEDTTGPSTRSGYRKLLADLGPSPLPPRPDRIDHREAGGINSGALFGTGLLGASALALASGQPVVAVALAAVGAAHNVGPEDYVGWPLEGLPAVA